MIRANCKDGECASLGTIGQPAETVGGQVCNLFSSKWLVLSHWRSLIGMLLAKWDIRIKISVDMVLNQSC